ncbi:oxygen-dependent protoporphyrinogen oxidase [Gonapodya sp. JEL0774]|nr:oxygen-dependent protoporphyrinogen oxidase [Gonapodya sp. JEL0774]
MQTARAPSIAVLGGGIAGLSAACVAIAGSRGKSILVLHLVTTRPLLTTDFFSIIGRWHLQKLVPSTIPITLIEQAPRFGGWLESEVVSRDGRPILFEGGPRTLRIAGEPGKAMLELVHSLGLASSLKAIPKTSPAARNRYIYRDGGVHLLDPSPRNLLFSSSPVFAGILRGGLREAFVSRNTADDESVWDFFARRFDPRMADTLASAICHGVYAGNSKELSMRSAFASMWEAERRSGSLIRDMVKGALSSKPPTDAPTQWSSPETDAFRKKLQQEATVVSFREGIGALPKAVIEELTKASNVTILKDACAARMELSKDSLTTTIHTSNGSSLAFSHVLSTLPSPSLSKLLPSVSQLSQIPYTTVAVINLAYPADILPLRGFGYLVPGPELENTGGVLGCVFDSESHGDPDVTRCTVMAGGWAFRKFFGDPDSPDLDLDRILHVAKQAMKKHLGVTVTPLATRVLIQRDCIPHYPVGHHRLLSEIQVALDEYGGRFQAFGAWKAGVSVNEGVLAGRRAAENIADELRAKV